MKEENYKALIVLFYVGFTAHWCYFGGGQEEWDGEKPLYEQEGKVSEVMKFWVDCKVKRSEIWTITKQEEVIYTPIETGSQPAAKEIK